MSGSACGGAEDGPGGSREEGCATTANAALSSALSVPRSDLVDRGRATTSLPVEGHTRSPSM